MEHNDTKVLISKNVPLCRVFVNQVTNVLLIKIGMYIEFKYL